MLAFSSGDTKKLPAEIKEAAPTHIPTVPRLLEKIHTRVVSQAEAAGGAKAEIFKRALATGEKIAKAEREGKKVSPIDKARHEVGDKLALSKVRDALGEGNPVLITGAAPIARRRHRVLLRLRRPRARGLRHDRDLRGRDAEHRQRGPRRQRRAPAARHRGLDRLATARS